MHVGVIRPTVRAASRWLDAIVAVNHGPPPDHGVKGPGGRVKAAAFANGAAIYRRPTVAAKKGLGAPFTGHPAFQQALVWNLEWELSHSHHTYSGGWSELVVSSAHAVSCMVCHGGFCAALYINDKNDPPSRQCFALRPYAHTGLTVTLAQAEASRRYAAQRPAGINKADCTAQRAAWKVQWPHRTSTHGISVL